MKRVLATAALLTLMGSAVLADMLYLKDGSVLKGTFVGYENGEFVFELGGGRRVTFPSSEVSRLVIERGLAGDNSGGAISGNPGPGNPGPGNTGGAISSNPDRPILTRRRDSEPRATEPRDPEPGAAEPGATEPRNSEPRNSEPRATERRDSGRPDRSGRILSRSGGSGGSSAPQSGGGRSSAPRSSSGGESSGPVEVRLEGQWVRSPFQVSRGQRVRVEASGTVYLEGNLQTGPEGVSGRRDPEAPMPDQNDGALLASIGQDSNAPPFLVGRSAEFTADRDGPLYFTVNHGETRGARGSFSVNVSVDRTTARAETPREVGGQKREKTVTVQANQPWTDTGIDVQPNMTFEIVAEGQIEIGERYASGPDGNQDAINRDSNYPIQGQGAGALIAKIRYRNGNDSNYVFVGSSAAPASEPNEYGRLFLGINDYNFQDNRGAFTVRIRY